MKYKMTVLFWIRKNKVNSNNEAAIYCRITINGVRASDFSTNIFTDLKNWDSKKQKIKCDESKQNQLISIRQRIVSLHLDLEMKDISITAELIKDIYTKKVSVIQKRTLKQLSEEFFTNELNTGKQLAQTIHRYKVRLGPVYQFLSEKKTIELTIVEITPQLVDELTDWLLYTKKYNPNYTIKIIQIIKQIFQYAIKKRFVTSNPFDFVKIKARQKPLIVLSKEELNSIMSHKFAAVRLQQVADLFLLQCFTGMAYVDIMNFDKKTHLQNDFICINRQKSETESLIPVLPQTRSLLEKYAYQIPKISNQKYNSYIKEVAEIVGIEKSLTTHIGRKTCGSILLNEGVSIEVVSRILGHRDTKITQHIYARVNELRITREIGVVNIEIKKEKESIQLNLEL